MKKIVSTQLFSTFDIVVKNFQPIKSADQVYTNITDSVSGMPLTWTQILQKSGFLERGETLSVASEIVNKTKK